MKKINKRGKKAQVGIEYMIIIGFLTFAITAVLVFAIFYSDKIKDRVRLNQVENFAIQLLNSAESVFFAGEPSKTTVSLYLPDGVEDINIIQDYLVITTRTSSGDNVREFKSRVPINGSISAGEGIKKLTLEAKEDHLEIRQ